MRNLIICAIIGLVFLPAALAAGQARLQTPGSRAAWGYWTRDGFRAGTSRPVLCERKTGQTTRVRRAFAAERYRSAGWYSSHSAPKVTHSGWAKSGVSIRRPSTAGARCYGYNGRYNSKIQIRSFRDYRVQRGAVIGAR